MKRVKRITSMKDVERVRRKAEKREKTMKDHKEIMKWARAEIQPFVFGASEDVKFELAKVVALAYLKGASNALGEMGRWK